ncbi:Maltodextrin phosphorylase [Poriferisphaera corsica]|uniref:glycogen phosphorylase n=1 Tax=Poriferisphaera corsica TaxID=2528020 RepID=A0A517YUF9_9BACT|nr:alpha-glucan family phosphorylase [Poriferisphaera corsica]QDU33817.1 Maltodextrin phosphorylase [Poriferisphaera corsica]
MLSPDLARIRSFKVVPSLPEPLKPLLDIANNMWWSWHPEAVNLFMRLDRELWQQTNHNPVKMLGMLPQKTLETMAKDEGFLSSLEKVLENFENHMKRTPWLDRTDHKPGDFKVAYFCSEFGLTECFQIYSGGLGILAGDHLKSASELGMPLVAVGLLYRHGYFQQYLNADGWQQEYLPDLDFANLPVTRVRNEDKQQLKVKVEMPGRDVTCGIWKVQVGRIPLYLLDTNMPENDVADRAITGQLYGGDMEMRIKQEIVLGIGGVRMLNALGIKPDVCHMNEGHSAFLALERIRDLIEEKNITFDEACSLASAQNVFTTHTPVPAGIDRFPPDMIKRYFKDYIGNVKLDMEGLLALGRENVFNKNEFFSMAVLAIRTSDWANGVSKLHGVVSRDMWHNIWPHVPRHEVPITHVTNGVHARTWLSGDLSNLLDRYLGSRWQNDSADHSVWQAVEEMPDEEIWDVHESRRQRMILWARRQLRKQMKQRGASEEHIRDVCDGLSAKNLTIGFARRFATYKRGNLILRDAERLLKLLRSTDKPVQFLIAGKSHPADGGGKDLIRQIVQFARQSNVAHRIVFIENYDMHVARYLVQGCDVWMNNPRRGMEASGTSGMKAALNGVLNCSIMDGWWDEAYESDLGWAIGRGEEYANPEVADDIESKSLYDLLEKEIVPLFYDRDDHGVPRGWVKKMKRCISQLAPMFNSNRQVQEYAEKLYLPALRRTRVLEKDNLKEAISYTHQNYRLRDNWDKLYVESVDAATESPLGVHDSLGVSSIVYLGDLKPEEVRVQVYSGQVGNDGELLTGNAFDMDVAEDLGDGKYRFIGSINAGTSGRYGFAIRIVPGGLNFEGMVIPGLILWEQPATKPQAAEPAPEQTEAVEQN